MQQQAAAGGERYAYVTTLGPGGYVSETRRVPMSSRPSGYLSIPPDVLFGEDLYAIDIDPVLDEIEDRSRTSKRRSRVDATSDAIEGLVQVEGASRSIRGEECPVCLQGFRADETLRAMPCCHAFHYDCISQWLRRNPVCPLCRHHLLVTQEEEEDEEEHQSQRRRTTT